MLLPQERQNEIIERIRVQGIVRVEKLASEFDVSAETIRRDLEKLEEEGCLRRVYGGAVLMDANKTEPLYALRAGLNMEHKIAIGRLASQLIKKGDTLVIDLGTTTLEFAKALAKHTDLLVITNSLHIASTTVEFQGFRVIIPGGHLRAKELTLSGTMTTRFLQQFHVNKTILGAGGIDLENGVTDYHIEEAEVRRTMIDVADEVIVLADHSKFGVTALSRVAPLKAIDICVTDWETPGIYLDKLVERDVKTIVAQKENIGEPS